ncbi:MAG: DUF4157 domain-containing protein [Anaerolineae bacterium]|nr:DUF4157 domain-containing protein [Anaerolineae bacterium]
METRTSDRSPRSHLPLRTNVLQRKCACGKSAGPTGTCAECKRKRQIMQTKLQINVPGDRYEREADRVADSVMQVTQPVRVAHGISPLPVSGLQRQAEIGSAEITAIDNAAQLGAGQPLAQADRAFFEPRLGHDFSQVRIHADGAAAQSARALNARAYTQGNHIVFGRNEFQPTSASGKHLLAHELTHTIQQRSQPAAIQRWTLGTGTPPHKDYKVVPADHQDTVKAAENILTRIVNNPKDFPKCHKFFEDNCVPGTPGSLKSKFDNATVWLDTEADPTLFGSGVAGDNVAYTDLTFRIGRWFIAGVMIHEFMHRCGQHNEATNDRAIKACDLPDVEIKSGNIVEK